MIEIVLCQMLASLWRASEKPAAVPLRLFVPMRLFGSFLQQ
jgi:hypothetical protein